MNSTNHTTTTTPTPTPTPGATATPSARLGATPGAEATPGTGRRRPRPTAADPAPRDEGAISMELAVLAPVAMLLLALLILAGRAALLDRAITQAASAAAREVTSQRPLAHAQASAEAGARDELTRHRVGCDGGPTVTVTTDGPLARVRLTCSMSAATTWFTPRTLTAQQLSAADPWKTR